MSNYRRTGFIGTGRAITRAHGNLIANAAGVPGVQMHLSPGVGAHNQGLAIDFQPGPHNGSWATARNHLQRIADVIYTHWDHLGVRYMAWNGEEFGGSNPVRTNRRRQRTNYGGSDPFHKNHVHVDFKPGARVRNSLPGSTPAGGSNNPGGITMGYAWPGGLKSHITGASLTPGTMLRDAQRKAHQGRDRAQEARNAAREARDFLKSDELGRSILNTRNNTSGLSHATHIRRGDMRFRGLDYVNDQPSTKDAQIARAHQYSRDARSSSRENTAMLKAMAKTLDDLLEGQGAVLRAVEEAEREVVQANAREVARELQITLKDDED